MRTYLAMALAATLLLCSSCDMFRKIAGRPTSREIEQKRQEIVLEKERIEALKLKQQAQADSLATLDSIRQMSTDIRTLSQIGEMYTTALDHKYYIIVGAFRQESNAKALLKAVSDAGYIPVEISYNNFKAVGLCPADRLGDAYLSLKSVMREDFCPADVWILVNG